MNREHPPRIRVASIRLFALVGAAALATPAQMVMTADGPGNTYPLIQSKGYGIEVPDCKHAVPHFTEVFDAELGENVFAAHAHRDQDDDRCMNFDRQRTEIRGGGTGLQGAKGSTTVYQWRFRLAPGFQASSNFTHIMQLKAYGNGHGSGAPIFIITPRNGVVELSHPRSGGVKRTAGLSQFSGVWVDAFVKIRHDDNGSCEVNLRRQRDGVPLLTWSGSNIDMWDDGAGYGALKLGIYRSLNSKSSLRDEEMRFNRVCVAVGSQVCPASSTPVFFPGPRDHFSAEGFGKWRDVLGRERELHERELQIPGRRRIAIPYPAK